MLRRLAREFASKYFKIINYNNIEGFMRTMNVKNLPSIAVACRSGTGKVVYSDFGLSMSEISKEEIDPAINGFACAFQSR